MSTADASQILTPDYLLDRLTAFVKQGPGLDKTNYSDRLSFNREKSAISRLKGRYLSLLADLDRSALTAEAIIDASGSRLLFDASKGEWSYQAGQYWPTEYRRAAVALVERLLIDQRSRG